ncbi:MAG: SBBP repeat-containing protein [Planctomycetota bacterium JB042]
MRLTFAGVCSDVRSQGIARKEAYVNFFVGRDPERWATQVPMYERVRFDGLYPGIDVEYHRAPNGELEYDLVLAPWADLSQVRVRVEGAANVEIGADGALWITTELGQIRQRPPRSFERHADGTRREVRSRIVAKGEGAFGFEVGRLDRTAVLVVDPQVGQYTPNYFTYLGGSMQGINDGMDQAADVDSFSGKATLTGTSASLDFDDNPNPGIPGMEQTLSGSTDTFVARLRVDGTDLLWWTYVGGSGGSPQDDEIGLGIHIDGSGAIYVAGHSTSNSFPAVPFPGPPTAFQPLPGGNGDAVHYKLTNTGTALEYSTYLGGDQEDVATDVAVDSSGNAYVCGFTNSWEGQPGTGSVPFPTTPAAMEQKMLFTAFAGFVTKFSTDGTSLAYSTLVRTPNWTSQASGGADPDAICWGISLDESNPNQVRAAVVGEVADVSPSSPFWTTSNAFQSTFGSGGGGQADGFVMMLNPTASSPPDFASFLGGVSEDRCSDVDVYGNADLAVVGETFSAVGFPLANAFQSVKSSAADAFVARIDPDAPLSTQSLLFSSYFGGNGFDDATAVVADSTGRHLYVTGHTLSTLLCDPAICDGIIPDHQGDYDAFLLKVSSFANSYFTYLGGAGRDEAWGIALDSGSVYIVGSSTDPVAGLGFYDTLASYVSPSPLGFRTNNVGGALYNEQTVSTEFPPIGGISGLDVFVLALVQP